MKINIGGTWKSSFGENNNILKILVDGTWRNVTAVKINIGGIWKNMTTSIINIIKISAGYYHSLAIDNNQVWSWGYNANGQLGDNSITAKCTPVSILGTKKTFCQITGGYYHSLGIDYNGQVWGWGYNNNGQLGDASKVSKRTPVSIHGAKKTFCQIIGGYYHSLGIDYTGQVWSWGYNDQGQLGDNSITAKCTPVSILGTKKTFCQITGGYYHSLGIDKNGQVWGWGYNNNGQLGDNSITSKRTPVSIQGTKKTFCQITSIYKRSLGLDYQGQVWGWGYNLSGEIGDNSTTDKCTPVSILGIKKTFCQIKSGLKFSLGLDKNGQVWSWGLNNNGQLGDNSIISKITPVSIHGVKKTFCQITGGGLHAIGIDYKDQLWGWGYNDQGQLGDNNTTSKVTPVSIHGAKKTFCLIASGYECSLGVDYLNQVWSWGYNNRGQLGDNSITSKRTPVSIQGVKKTFCQIIGGSAHSLGIDYTGQVWSWGNNTNGQLGDNSITSKRTPVSILGTKKTFCQIAGGSDHSLGIDKNGQVWCWGYNNRGQLGDNSITSKRTPVSIQGAKKTFCKIIAGFTHSLGIDYQGQFWSWGSNAYGQLGVNSTASKRTPVSILGTKKTFCQIAGGYYHSLGIDYTGQVWSWGNNNYAQLGDNSTTSYCTPVSIHGVKKTFCQIVGGGEYSLGIDYTGQVWGWGYNLSGQLGDNSITAKCTPVSILGTKKTFCKIIAGSTHSLGIDYTGQFWSWGRNNYSQLGNNYNTTTPIRICNF